MADPERILIRGVNWLGDAVMTLPAIQRLRERFPSARITLFTPEKLGDLWEFCPHIDGHLAFNPGHGFWPAVAKLRSRKFDLGIVFPNSTRSALELFFARIPVRVGSTDFVRKFLLTQPVQVPAFRYPMRKKSEAEIQRLIHENKKPVRPPTNAHHLLHYLHLAAALGGSEKPVPPNFFINDQSRIQIIKQFAEVAAFIDKGGVLAGLNPGAEYGPAKRWPKAKFLETAARLSATHQLGWVILGGARDVEDCQWIEAGLRARQPQIFLQNLAGKTSLRDLCGLLTSCRVMLTNDTGPMHLAAAFGIPVVVPFGSTSPELTGPGLFSEPGSHELLTSDVPCSPCFRRECPIDFRCMERISVEKVVETVSRVLANQHDVT